MAPPPPPPPPPVDRDPDPFCNDYAWTPYNVAKAVLCAVWLLPLRLACLVAAVGVAAAFGLLAACFVPVYPPGEEEPLPPALLLLFWPIRLSLRLALLGFGFWWIPVADERRAGDAAPAIIVGNHVALMDILFMGYYFNPSILGKHTLQHTPVIGLLGRLAQTIFVRRADPQSRAAARRAIQRRATTPGFRPLLIFPEGTCANGRCLIAFQHGAFLPGLPVLPVVLRYPHRHLNPAYCGAPGRNPFLLLLQFANRMEVRILRPYRPTEEERARPDLFARNVRELYKAALGVPAVDRRWVDTDPWDG
eukprot:EG_transcript_18380